MTLSLRSSGPDQLDQLDEVGQCSRAHFAHSGATMNFYRDHAYPEIASHLLVHLAGGHQQHHFPFSCGQAFESLTNLEQITFGRTALSIALDGKYYGIEHVLIAKRLGQKVNGAALHSTNRHRYIAVSGYYYNGQAYTLFHQLSLEVEPVHIGQPDIDYDAAWHVGEPRIQKIASRCIRLRVEPYGIEQALQCTTHRRIIVDNMYDRPIT